MFRYALTLLAVASLATPAQAEDPCETGLIQVSAPSAPLERKTCQAAGHAVAVFAECGFELSEPVTIKVTGAVPDDCLAVYHCGENLIEILDPATMQEARSPEGSFAHVPVDRLYDSAIVHELAHALYDPVDCPYDSCLATAEYLAYTYQIASLGAADRAPFDHAVADIGHIYPEAINPMILMLAPRRFALKSWAHLGQRPDRCTYLGSIMAGATIFDHPLP